MNKHINITSKTYYSRNKITRNYNKWNYYLSLNKYPIVVYFCYYSDTNTLVHKVRQQVISLGGKVYTGGQHLHLNKGVWWEFITKGNTLTLLFSNWAAFTSFTRGEMGKKLISALPLVTLSIQGNYLNLNHNNRIEQILDMGNNYFTHMASLTYHLMGGFTPLLPAITMSIYNLVWVITCMLTSLIMCINMLSYNTQLYLEYRSTLLINTSNTSE